jgi:hypothetical protein
MSKMFLARALSTKTLVSVAFTVASLVGVAHAQSTNATPADGSRSAPVLQGQNPMEGGGG